MQVNLRNAKRLPRPQSLVVSWQLPLNLQFMLIVHD